MKRQLVAPILMIGLAHAADALACGGFFCSQTPVLQTAERVIFEIDGDQITAYVQLQYQGNDPNFAWIVPVPARLGAPRSAPPGGAPDRGSCRSTARPARRSSA